MKDFDPFRLSQRFEPEEVEGPLPPLGLLEELEEADEQTTPPRRFNFLVLLGAVFLALLLGSILCQMDSGKPVLIQRSIFD